MAQIGANEPAKPRIALRHQNYKICLIKVMSTLISDPLYFNFLVQFDIKLFYRIRVVDRSPLIAPIRLTRSRSSQIRILSTVNQLQNVVLVSFISFLPAKISFLAPLASMGTLGIQNGTTRFTPISSVPDSNYSSIPFERIATNDPISINHQEVRLDHIIFY